MNRALLNCSRVGNRKIISLLVRYGARNFQECIDSAPQTNHISSFLRLCLSALKGDSEAIKIILHTREEDICDLPRFDELMRCRLILLPLLQNGRFSLSIPIHVALTEGQVAIAGEIVRLSSSRPTSGVIDWHDLEMNHMEASWFDIPGITHLVYIGLSSNRLRCLPERVLDFKSLQKLQIHHNCISYLPAELFNMPNLKVIDASFNKIVSLPEILRYPLTSSLENLNLASNRLTDLPNYFINSKIVVLDISSNRLSKVPDCAIHLHRLNTLSLDYNIGIEFIPYEIGNLPDLAVLGLKGLPYLKNIPSRKDITPIRFLKSRARSPQLFLHYDVAVITDDSHNVCKDIVLQSIQQHSRRKHYSYLAYSSKQQFLNFQQSFSLPCTVYLVLWDCESGQKACDLFPIISHLIVYAPNAPIIVAACWMSAITPKTHSDIQDQVKASLWCDFEKKGVLSLLTVCVDKDALVSRSNSLQYLTEILHRKGEVSAVHLNVPNSYTALQTMLQQHAASLKQQGMIPIVCERQLWDLIRQCQHNDLASHKELPMLVSYLTDIAFILCLISNRSSESNMYVLNRQWFVDALSGLLNPNPHIGNPSGLYPIHYISDLLSGCSTVPSDLPYAFTLFVSQLGLAIAVTSLKVLVPAMLSSVNTESSSDFSSQFDVRRIYTFRLVPLSFWGRLIAHLLINMDQLITMTALDSVGEVIDGIRFLSDSLPGEEHVNWNYWKEGMVVYIGGSSLLFSVEAIEPILEPEYREGIEIRVRNTPIGTKAMNMITTTINTLLRNWYKELWQTVEISVPCPQCIRANEYTLFSFHNCCHALASGHSDNLRCPHHNQAYSAASLVPDLVQANGHTLFTTTNMVSFSIDDKSTCLSPPPSETVFKGVFGDISVAVKPFPPPIPNGERSANPFLDFWHEYTILNHLSSSESNPYVIDLQISIISPLALVFPYARFCSLEEVIQEKQISIPPILRIRILYQLAHALEVLHSLKVIHRNVCLANIFVFSLSLDDTINIKLGGFSDSCIALNQGLAIGEYGTFPAPEMNKYGYQYDERVDVFAYAFTSYEILSRRKLKFRRGVRFQAASCAMDRPTLNNVSKIAPHLTTVIEKCWNNDEGKRPFFGEIVTTFQNPLHIVTREGDGISELQDFNAATVRFTRRDNGTFKGDLYLCSSIYSKEDTAMLAYLGLPGLGLKETTALPSRFVVCMCCTAQYLWISFNKKDVRIYSTETLEFVKLIEFEHFVLAMAISPDAVYLGLDNGEVQMYKMSNPTPLHSPHKTRIVSFQKSIESIQILEDCVICCTRRSCIRIHPETLHPEQEFPVVSETEVRYPVLCVDREKGEEYLWVSFRRMQELVVFNALTGKALYGFNSCEVLSRPKNEVWVTTMLSVLDTVWVGMNTGHVLIFNAFTQQPHLLTYFKIHTEKVDRLMLLQPSYWGTNTPNYYYNDLVSESEESDDGDVHRNSYPLSPFEVPAMPQTMLVMSCGRGIEQKIPKIGSDGTVMMDNTSSSSACSIGVGTSPPRLYLLMMDAPDSIGAHKLECQAHRPPVPYMENYRPDISTSSDSYLPNINIPEYDISLNHSTHRPVPIDLSIAGRKGTADSTTKDNATTAKKDKKVTTPVIRDDPSLSSFVIPSISDVPPVEELDTQKDNITSQSTLRKIPNLFKKTAQKNHSPPSSQQASHDVETNKTTNGLHIANSDLNSSDSSKSDSGKSDSSESDSNEPEFCSKNPGLKPPDSARLSNHPDSDTEGSDSYVPMQPAEPIIIRATCENLKELNSSIPK